MSDERAGLSEDVKRQVADALLAEVAARPPRFGLVGVSGVGKSSTINAMFRTDLPTSDTVACTREFRAVPLSVKYHDRRTDLNELTLTVVDAPGLGEDLAKDDEYLAMYEQGLEHCDVVLWVMSARNRAVALDQSYLRRLHRFHDRMVLGINQVDLIAPLNWVERYNLPSREQERNMRTIQDDRIAKIRPVVGRGLPVVSYSARFGYQLQELFTMVLRACPEHRRWIYAGLQNFKYTDFLPDGGTAGAGLINRIFGNAKDR